MENNLSFDFPEISNNEEFGLFSNNNEETKNMNFNQYKSKIYNDLNTLENNIINELLNNDTELISMLNNFNESENILNSLESSLLNFKEKLTGINYDMKHLQNKSNEISVKLKNRKDFEENLFKLLDSVILAPEFLNDLTNKEIEEDFIEKLKKLDEKLEVFKKGELPESQAVNDIIPEMQKTLAKVCSKIYLFIVNKFQMFQKPNTNIQVIQDVILNKNKYLVQFLRKHAIVMYNDLVNKYISIMEKIYSSGTSLYVAEIGQFINDKSEKISLISSDDIPKDLFQIIEKRITILDEIDQTSIMPMIAKQKQQKFYYEETFRSMNKFIMDLIITEVIFFSDFFGMDPSVSCLKLNEIFKSTLNLISDFVKRNCITKTNDFVALALMIIVNIKQSSMMVSQKLNHLEFYFESLSTWLWLKFDEVFKKYIDFFFKQNIKSMKYVSNGIHIITYKLGEFLHLVTLIYKHSTQSPMLLSRLKQIHKTFNQFYSEIIETNKMTALEREEATSAFFINNLFYLLRKLEGFQEFFESNDPEAFNKTFDDKLECFINLLFKKYFDELNKVISNCLSKSELTDITDYSTNNLNNYNYLLPEISKLKKTDLKYIALSFNSKYKDFLELIKKDIFELIKDKENARSIYKKFLSDILSIKYYHFTEILKKSGNEEILGTIISHHKLMLEITNILKII